MMMKCNCKAIGRVLIGLMFAIFGALKIAGFDGTVAFIASAGVPMASVVAVVAIVLELGGGILLIANRYRGYATYALIAYMVIITLVMHRNIGDQLQLTMFLKNVGILGGLLAICPCKNCDGCSDDQCDHGACANCTDGKCNC